MNFEPTNRHILVSIEEQKKEEQQSLIMLPDDYKKPEDPYLVCTIDAISSDSKLFSTLQKGQRIVIERRMLQKVDIDGISFYLVLDNYILGSVK